MKRWLSKVARRVEYRPKVGSRVSDAVGVRESGNCRDDLDGGLCAISSLLMRKIKEGRRRSAQKQENGRSDKQSGGGRAGADLVG